jgi:hypothetical protein
VHTILAIVKPLGSTTHVSRQVDFTAIIMMLVRLDTVKTDFLVFINVPHRAGDYAADTINLAEKKWGPLIEQAAFVKGEIQKSLRIIDWGLFGDEEDATMEV